MNKSTLGIGILVSMVLAKTIIGWDNEISYEAKTADSIELPQKNFETREAITDLAIVEHEGVLDLVPSKIKEEDLVIETNELSEVLPLESYTFTGYGSWQFDEETESNEEAVPLDRGNTITEQMSLLFPVSN